MPTAALPPGRLGLPFAGETLSLLRNPFAFVETRRRKHGDVFKSRVLGRNVVFLAGTAGAEAFYDEDNISRANAHPYPILDLFGGVNMEMYDGPRHTALKAITTIAFDKAAVAGYLPDMQRLIEARLDGWSDQPEFSATSELRKLAIEVICLNLLGLEPGPPTDAIARDYAAVLKGIVSVPVPVPATPYRHARQARDRLLATIAALVADRRATPTDDGLSKILTARAPDGRTITDDEAVLEVHHVVIAGFIVYALMAEVIVRLRESPILLARCAAEIGDGPVTLASLDNLDTARQTVMEAKRLVPLVPLAFGRAKRDFTCGGHRVPADWTVYLALRLCNLDPGTYTAPERFDHTRFDAQRAEDRRHPLAFIPQGAGPHQCLGLDYSTYLVLTFMAVLVRGYRWELPSQDFRYVWATVPPEPRDGLRVQLRRRAEAATTEPTNSPSPA